MERRYSNREVGEFGQRYPVNGCSSQHIVCDDGTPLVRKEVIQKKSSVDFAAVRSAERHPAPQTAMESFRNDRIPVQCRLISKHDIARLWSDATCPAVEVILGDVPDL